MLLRFAERLLQIRGVQRGDIDIHAAAWLERGGYDPADDQREGGHDLKVDERFEPNSPQSFEAAHSRDAGYDGRENDWRDHHPNQPDEAVAQGFEICTIKAERPIE